MIVVVSGLPRSGTSLMMRILEAGGVEPVTDGERVADDDNPRGYYEDERVKRLGADASWLAEADGKAVKVVSPLLGKLPARHAYKVIFMRRDLSEVLASQARMLERRGEPQGDEGVLRRAFTAHLEQVEDQLDDADHMEVLYVSYARLVTDPGPQLERICAFLPDLRRDTLEAVIEPALYRRRRG